MEYLFRFLAFPLENLRRAIVSEIKSEPALIITSVKMVFLDPLILYILFPLFLREMVFDVVLIYKSHKIVAVLDVNHLILFKTHHFT